MATIQLANGAEIKNADKIMPITVERDGREVVITSPFHLKPGDRIEVVGVLPDSDDGHHSMP